MKTVRFLTCKSIFETKILKDLNWSSFIISLLSILKVFLFLVTVAKIDEEEIFFEIMTKGLYNLNLLLLQQWQRCDWSLFKTTDIGHFWELDLILMELSANPDYKELGIESPYNKPGMRNET